MSGIPERKPLNRFWILVHRHLRRFWEEDYRMCLDSLYIGFQYFAYVTTELQSLDIDTCIQMYIYLSLKDHYWPWRWYKKPLEWSGAFSYFSRPSSAVLSKLSELVAGQIQSFSVGWTMDITAQYSHTVGYIMITCTPGMADCGGIQYNSSHLYNTTFVYNLF